jgi:membrane-bound ClpP family serine protease
MRIWGKDIGRFERGWSGRIVFRYILLQLPGVAVPALLLFAAWKWFDFSLWFVFLGILIFVVKDVVLFPFVWKAYDRDSPVGVEIMQGSTGIAEERIDPEGYVLVRGELWHARVTDSKMIIEKGAYVKVVGGKGLTLLVEADPQKDEWSGPQNFDNGHKT